MAKTEEIAIGEARELVANQTLWPRVRAFLYDFADQIHESRLDGSVGAGLETTDAGREGNADPSLVSRLSSSPRVKRFVLESLGVEPFFHTFPKDDGSRLALLDGATLEAVVHWLGALALAGELRRVTDGATVRALKAALPGVYPEVFGYVAYFGALGGESSDGAVVGASGGEGGVADAVVSTGYGILLASLENLPEPLVARLKLKLPKRLTAQRPDDRTTRPSNRLTAILKLLKLKFPKDYALCCS